MRDLQTALDKANDYRKRADEALKVGRDQRDETLRKTYVPVITDSVDAALKVWFSALYTTAKNDPKLALLASIKEIGWHMRDYSGRERSYIAQSIAAARGLDPRDGGCQRPIPSARRYAVGAIAALDPRRRHPARDPGGDGQGQSSSISRISAAAPTNCARLAKTAPSIR